LDSDAHLLAQRRGDSGTGVRPLQPQAPAARFFVSNRPEVSGAGFTLRSTKAKWQSEFSMDSAIRSIRPTRGNPKANSGLKPSILFKHLIFMT
jgi:hypothetical protein